MKRRFFLLASICVLLGAPTVFPQNWSENPPPSPSTPPEGTPSALVRPRLIHKWSLKTKATIAGTILVIGLAALAFSVRRWTMWNLFDRQYRLPRVENGAVRLGGKKSGGCMGRIDFG